MISLRNITKEYRINEGCTIKALDSVSFDIYDSGVLYILGKSGCGKTTLLNVIGSLDSIDSGDILVDGKELASFTTQDIYSYRDSYIGFVFQEYNLIENLTVYENIKIALDIRRDSSLDKIRDVLDKVGLNGFENRKISELSGGQKQRVAIARTLVKSPKMILADEPTGNLDSATSKEIFDLLKDISKNTSVVIVSHDKESAQVYADRIVNMRDGKVIDINEMRPSGKIDENVLSLKKNYGLSLINSLKFALNGIKKRVFRFTMIVLIMILCLSSISFALAATYNDVNKIFLDACDKYDQDSVCVRKFDLSNSLKLSGDLCFNINNNDVSRITNIFDDDGIIVYNSNVDIPLARNIIYFSESTSFSLCAPSYDYINNHGLKIIYGRYPIYNNEVMISSAMFDIFKRCGFSKINGEELEISSIDQLLGEQIEGRIENYTIVGIIDTKPNESLYRQFLELYDNDPLSLDTNRVAGIMSYELYDSIHTSLFFSEDAFKYGLISEAGISFIGQNSLNRDDGLHVKRLTNTRFEDANEEPFLLQNYNDSVGVVLSLDFLLQFHRELLDDGKHDWYLKYNSNMQSYDDWVEFISNENVYVYFTQ